MIPTLSPATLAIIGLGYVGLPLAGDVQHSLADIDKAGARLGYQASHRSAEGMSAAIGWYISQHSQTKAAAQNTAEP